MNALDALAQKRRRLRAAKHTARSRPEGIEHCRFFQGFKQEDDRRWPSCIVQRTAEIQAFRAHSANRGAHHSDGPSRIPHLGYFCNEIRSIGCGNHRETRFLPERCRQKFGCHERTIKDKNMNRLTDHQDPTAFLPSTTQGKRCLLAGACCPSTIRLSICLQIRKITLFDSLRDEWKPPSDGD